MSTSYCWVERREVEGFDVEECTHPDCVNDDRSQYASVWEGPYAACIYERWHTPCELPEGHTGPHVFEPTDHEPPARLFWGADAPTTAAPGPAGARP